MEKPPDATGQPPGRARVPRPVGWLQRHSILLFSILVLALSVVFVWQLSSLSTRLVHAMALQNAELYSRSIAEFRAIYTSEVVDRVRPHGIDVTHDYATRDGTIPLPATLSMLLGRRIGDSVDGDVTVRLYSAHPFPWRKDGGPQDDFQRLALAALEQRPDQPFFRFDQQDGRLELRYATADRMQPQCVGCHNSHPDSPKRDWKAGDVRGVLEIRRTLEWAQDEVAAGVRRAALVVAICSTALLVFLALAMRQIRRTHEALLSGEHRFQAVADTANDAIVSADQAGTITYVNRSAERMFGYRANELLGQPLTRLMPERFHAAHSAGLNRYLKTGESRVIGKPVTLVGLKKDNSEFPVELTLASWRAEGETMFSGIIRDITERKQSELVMEQKTAELTRSNAELERFAYVASHDLQEPLRTVSGFAQLLAARPGNTADPDAQEFVGYITEAVHRMRDLIDGLLAYSRVSRPEDQVQPTDLNATMQRVVANLGATIESSNAVITVDTLPTVNANPGLMLQLLQNLVANALKFRGPAPPAVHVSAAREAQSWRVSVRDNGIGINPQHAERIFVLFQRLHTRAEIPGNGLGLAICKKIIEQHGGRIWVEPGNPGAIFHFTLPA